MSASDARTGVDAAPLLTIAVLFVASAAMLWAFRRLSRIAAQEQVTKAASAIV